MTEKEFVIYLEFGNWNLEFIPTLSRILDEIGIWNLVLGIEPLRGGLLPRRNL
jgi:hypothetical protein